MADESEDLGHDVRHGYKYTRNTHAHHASRHMYIYIVHVIEKQK